MPQHPILNAAALELLQVFLPLACCDILSSMLQHWSYCHFADFFNAATFNLQCLAIQSLFLFLSSFCIFSFFFWFQCSSYHLQYKIRRKCVQNDNNTNKITKYWGLKIHQISLISANMTRPKRKSMPPTTWVKNSQIMNPSTLQWKRCVVH